MVLVGSSEKSWADAAQTPVNEAIKTIRGVRGVKDLTAKVDSKTGKILEYRVSVKLSFAVERSRYLQGLAFLSKLRRSEVTLGKILVTIDYLVKRIISKFD
jgi:flavin-binding protein dodecin